MAQPYIKVAERNGVTTVSFHEAIGKGTRTVKRLKLDKPTHEEIRVAIVDGLTEVRAKLGSQEK